MRTQRQESLPQIAHGGDTGAEAKALQHVEQPLNTESEKPKCEVEVASPVDCEIGNQQAK